METLIKSLEELDAEAARFVEGLIPEKNSATLINLSGELGAGKTAFTKAVARVLGVVETVNSPTFVIEKIYLLPEKQKFRRLIHIDAYRLENGKSLSPLGFDEIVKDEQNLILLEWPEKVSEAIQKPTAQISLKVLSDESRMISYG
jgi:tRNA threonylcarbamoyladenosine biosynthesis protein TsaE